MRSNGSTSGWLRNLLRPPYGASLGAVILAGVCVGAVAALHVLRTDLDPFRHVLSEYANGGQGVLMTAVFYAMGLACLALGWRLRSAVAWHGVTRAVPALLMLAGVALAVAGVFEVGLPGEPDTTAETIHSDASIGAFVLLIVAMSLFVVASGRDRRWRSFRPTAAGLAAVAVVAGALSPFVDGSAWTGVAQRVLAAAVLAWVLLTALRVRANAFGARG